MEQEIETRFLEINKEELVKKLISLGAIDYGEEKLEEIIFHFDDSVEDAKNSFVRLRKMKNKIKLTYKTNRKQAVDSAMEIEFEISNLEKGKAFLEKLGLKKVRELEKYRHTLSLGEVTFDIDTWPRIPVYVEVEGPTVDSLKNVCKQINFDWEKRFDGDARQVYKHYGYNIDDISVLTYDKFE